MTSPTDKIPEDVMKAAWTVVGEIDADFTHDMQTSGQAEMADAWLAIARAIMERDERAAKIALEIGDKLDPAVGFRIASAIRGGS